MGDNNGRQQWATTMGDDDGRQQWATMMGDDGGRQGSSNALFNMSEATRWVATWRPNVLNTSEGGQVTRVRDQENEGLVVLNTSEVGDEAESRDEGEPHMR